MPLTASSRRSRSIGTGGRDPSEQVVTIVGMRTLVPEPVKGLLEARDETRLLLTLGHAGSPCLCPHPLSDGRGCEGENGDGKQSVKARDGYPISLAAALPTFGSERVHRKRPARRPLRRLAPAIRIGNRKLSIRSSELNFGLVTMVLLTAAAIIVAWKFPELQLALVCSRWRAADRHQHRGKILPRHARRVRRVRDESSPRALIGGHRQGARNLAQQPK
jgi:hypothetical protein